MSEAVGVIAAELHKSEEMRILSVVSCLDTKYWNGSESLSQLISSVFHTSYVDHLNCNSSFVLSAATRDISQSCEDELSVSINFYE